MGREGRAAPALLLPDHRGGPQGPGGAARGLEPVRRGARPGGRREVRVARSFVRYGADIMNAPPRLEGPRPRQARAPAPDLPPHTVDELAAHLEDIYLDALQAGRDEADAHRAPPKPRSAESPLATVPRSRTRGAGGAAVNEIPSGSGLDRARRRRALRLAAVAAVAVVRRHRDPDARARRRRRDRDLQHRRHRPAAAAAVPRSREQLVAIWESNAEKGAAEGTAVAGQLHGLPRHTQAAFSDAAAWWRPEVNLAEPGTRAGPGQHDRNQRATSFSCSASSTAARTGLSARTVRSTRATASRSSAIGCGGTLQRRSRHHRQVR